MGDGVFCLFCVYSLCCGGFAGAGNPLACDHDGGRYLSGHAQITDVDCFRVIRSADHTSLQMQNLFRRDLLRKI